MNNYKLEKLGNSKVKIQLTFVPEDLTSFQEKELNRFVKTAEVPGFRKGSAPKTAVMMKYIKEIATRATEEAVNTALNAAIKAENIFPIETIKYVIVDNKSENEEDKKKLIVEAEFHIASELIELPVFEKLSTDADIKAREERLDQIIADTKWEAPLGLIELEVNHRFEHFKTDVEKLGLEVQKYLEATGKTEEEMKKSMTDELTKQLKTDQVLAQIIKTNNLTVTPEEVRVKQLSIKSEDLPKTFDPSMLEDYVRRLILSEKILATV